ncbi:MAG: hypothetical protein ACREAK_05600 [Nitrosarchaeum sp.]
MNILLLVLLLAGIGGIGAASLAPLFAVDLQDVGVLENCYCVDNFQQTIPCPATLENANLICPAQP